MKMFFFSLLCILTLSSPAFAGGGEYYCKGKQGKTTVVLEGKYPGLMSLNDSTGILSVNDREVARFGSGDINVRKIKRTVTAKNNHDDFLQGRLLDINSGDVMAEFIMAPGYGIFMVNVKLTCRVYPD